ncbi:recombination protein NinG [Erwinia sp.]|uniref:recombination protein NinG n=1 Tax=Erwinia citreus TaxID=558 RepID=UPI003C76177E
MEQTQGRCEAFSHWMNLNQRAFNDCIRARDGEICISCGSTTAVSYHARHYRTTAVVP